jgi:hypothetical protein
MHMEPTMHMQPMAMHMEVTSLGHHVMESGSILNPTPEEIKQAQARWEREREERNAIKLAALEDQGIRLADFPGPRQVAKI